MPPLSEYFTHDIVPALADDYPFQIESEDFQTLNDLPRLAAVGRVDLTGVWTLSVFGANNGSEIVRGFLAEPVEATGGTPTRALIYKAGSINQDGVTFGAGLDLETAKVQLEGTPLFLKPVTQR